MKKLLFLLLALAVLSASCTRKGPVLVEDNADTVLVDSVDSVATDSL